MQNPDEAIEQYQLAKAANEAKMTTEQQRKMLEAAAKACGIEYWVVRFSPRSAPIEKIHTTRGGETVEWNPIDNLADTAEMCAKLGINTVWFSKSARCGVHDGDSVGADLKDHDNSRLKAWMAAATMVAAKIGGYEE